MRGGIDGTAGEKGPEHPAAGTGFPPGASREGTIIGDPGEGYPDRGSGDRDHFHRRAADQIGNQCSVASGQWSEMN